jgi:MSHA biogenesis protein MshO
MRPTRPENRPARARGVSLIELVLAIVVTGIVLGAVSYFLYPVQQSVDIAVRAELTDVADTTLQRIARDVRLALPNSVRVTSTASASFVEFIEIRTAGRYRADSGQSSSGTDCDNDDPALGQPGNDQLSFDTVADRCFKTIGKLPIAPAVGDYLVLSNYGPRFDGQNAYAASGTLNRAQIDTVDTSEATRERIRFTATPFQRALHDSPGKRFYAVTGPVSYACDTVAGTVTRYWGYGFAAPPNPDPPQPTTFSSGSLALIASNVSGCVFDYTANIAPQVGLLTLRLTLSKATSGGTPETVSLYHAVHVSNVP